MKLNKKQIQEIKSLRANGEAVREIARQFKINPSTVCYHLDRENILKRKKIQWNEKPTEEKRKIYAKNLSYLKEYQKNRYEADEEFRERKKKRSKEYYARKSSNKNKNKN